MPLIDRRRAVAGLACCAAASQAIPAAAAARRSFIDVHHHFTPPGVAAAVGTQPWSPLASIEEMDRNRVQAAVGFLGGLVGGANAQGDQRRARDWNEFAARVCTDHRGRFGFFAAVPLTDVGASLAELAYAFDVLGADGIGVVTNYGDRWLGDPLFRPIWEEANRRKAVVYVHPTDAPCCTPASLSYMIPPVYGPWAEWPVNTARTILSLMLNGVLRQFPDIRFIFSHGGGVMPLLVDRIAAFDQWGAVGPDTMQRLFPNGIRSEFAKLHFECAQAYSPANMAAVRALAPDTSLLFGTDYNRFPIQHSVRTFEALDLSASTALAIAQGNARRLLRRFTV